MGVLDTEGKQYFSNNYEIMTKIIEKFNVTKEYVLALLTPQKA